MPRPANTQVEPNTSGGDRAPGGEPLARGPGARGPGRPARLDITPVLVHWARKRRPPRKVELAHGCGEVVAAPVQVASGCGRRLVAEEILRHNEVALVPVRRVGSGMPELVDPRPGISILPTVRSNVGFASDVTTTAAPTGSWLSAWTFAASPAGRDGAADLGRGDSVHADPVFVAIGGLSRSLISRRVSPRAALAGFEVANHSYG
jgi:hypothetical protein